jgi:hypothetical protein
MTRPKLLFAAATLSALAAAPSLAQAADLPVHLRAYSLPYPISYSHNYGPGPLPGTCTRRPLDQCLSTGAATYIARTAAGTLLLTGDANIRANAGCEAGILIGLGESALTAARTGPSWFSAGDANRNDAQSQIC